MRGIGSLVIGLALAGLVCAQGSQPAAIKVTLDGDGVIKFIDAKTGKVISTQVQDEGRKPIPIGGDTKRNIEKARQAIEQGKDVIPADQLDQLRKLLDGLLKEEQGAKGKRVQIQPDKKVEAEFKSITVIIGPDGKAQIITGQDPQKPDGQPKVIVNKKTLQLKPGAEPAAPATLEGKIDRLLKEMAELRKDVNDLKKRMDGKQPGEFPWQQFIPPGGWGGWGPDKKPGAAPVPVPKPGANSERIQIHIEGADKLDKETLKQIHELLKKYGIPADQLEPRELPKKQPPTQKQTERIELQERLLRIQREAEELRRAIEKAK